ncbi:metal-dependent hydrolase, partial [bacterium]|nr:metal-dependent hydrolase [bacterium]
MMSLTHAAIALTTTSISLGTANAFTLGVAIIGSQLPDLDSTQSFIGRMLFPIARLIEERFP